MESQGKLDLCHIGYDRDLLKYLSKKEFESFHGLFFSDQYSLFGHDFEFRQGLARLKLMGCDCIPFLSDQEIRDYYIRWQKLDKARERNTSTLYADSMRLENIGLYSDEERQAQESTLIYNAHGKVKAFKYLNLSALKDFGLIDPETLKCSRNGHVQCFDSIISPYRMTKSHIVMLDLTKFDVEKLGKKFLCKCYLCESDVPLNLEDKVIESLINAVTALYSKEEGDKVKVENVRTSMKKSMNK